MATQLNITGLDKQEKEFSLGDNKMTNSGTGLKAKVLKECLKD